MVNIEIRGAKNPFFEGSGDIRLLQTESVFLAYARRGIEVVDNRIEIESVKELIPSQKSSGLSLS